MEVINNFTKGNLRQVYNQHFENLRSFLYYKTGSMETAEDLVQEVFVIVWERRSQIRMDTIKGLLYAIAKNLMINHFRHQKTRRSHQSAETADSGNGEFHSPQFLLEEKEFEQKLNRVIMSIPDGSREVFLMNRIDKLTYNEIAERLGIRVKAVEKRMRKALNIIKEELGMKI